MTFDAVMVAQIVAFGAFLWLGFFILSRALRQTPVTILTFVGLATQASFFMSSVIIDHSALPNGTGLDVDLLVRLFWWNNVLPIAIWFHMTTMVTHRNRPVRAVNPVVIALYTAALLFTVLGMFTDVIINYANGRNSGPAYPFFVVYLAVAGVGALWNLVRTFFATLRRSDDGAERRAIINELRLVVPGGVLFLVGGLYLALINMLDIRGYNAPGALLALFGLGLLGYGLVHYDMMVEGRDVRRDFVYALVGIVSVNTLYVLPFVILGVAAPYTLLLLVGLATLTHSTVDFWRSRLDTLFFSRPEREAREAARSYATELGTIPTASVELTTAILEPVVAEAPPPDAPAEADSSGDWLRADDEKGFNDLTRKAITGLKSQPQMVRSPLLGLQMVEQRLRAQGISDNRLNRAAVLREILLEKIDGLRPADTDGDEPTPDALRFYNVLYYPYVRAISHKAALGEAARLRDERRRRGERDPTQHETALNWLADVDENTFYKWQRKASDTIAATLREEELAARGVAFA